MEESPAPRDANETLAIIGRRIHCSLKSLEKDAWFQEAEDSTALLNESQRFGLWAKNLGLFDLGHNSLDYRFRDAPVVYEYTRHLLVDLEKSIWKSLFAILPFLPSNGKSRGHRLCIEDHNSGALPPKNGNP